MSSLLQSTANTRQTLPGSFRYLLSDAPTSPTEANVALLQRQAGLSRAEIVADHVLSGENLRGMFKAFMETHPETDAAIYTPAAEYMERFLDLLEQ